MEYSELEPEVGDASPLESLEVGLWKAGSEELGSIGAHAVYLIRGERDVGL
jgi:hypothetical protein